MAAPDAPLVITLRDVYDAVTRLSERVTSLSGELAYLRTKLDSGDQDRADHESRLRALEQRRWPLQSAALVVSILSAVGVVVVGVISLIGG